MLAICLVLALSLASTIGDPNETVYGPFGYEGIQPAIIATCDILSRSGLTCRDCDNLSRCVLMNHQWQTYDVDYCDVTDGMYCNSIMGQCSTSIGPCNQPEFRCNEEGYFPNPYSCQEFNYCLTGGLTLTHIPRDCDAGYAYSVATRQCTLTIQDPICSTLQWSCSYPGQIFGWPGTDDLFYICQRDPQLNELIPDLHRCLNNQIFDGNNCVNR